MVDQAEENPPVLIDLAEAIIAFAKQQLGKPYKIGAEGPDRYDCSGLIFDCFKRANALDLIGGERKRARGYYNWFNSRGWIGTTIFSATPGNLVVYGRPDDITHIGIYLGGPKRKVISALVNPFGVTKHRYNGIVTATGAPEAVVAFLKPQYPRP